jgi:predicted small metal-binding protein
MVEIGCQDVSIEGCAYVARGENEADVLESMVNHLSARHGFRLSMHDLENPDQIERMAERLLARRLRDRTFQQTR